MRQVSRAKQKAGMSFQCNIKEMLDFYQNFTFSILKILLANIEWNVNFVNVEHFKILL